MLLTTNLASILRPVCTKDGWGLKGYELKKLDKATTYVVVFAEHQKLQLKAFKASKEINVLYEAPKAVNKTYGHGTAPRNTLVIFELKD